MTSSQRPLSIRQSLSLTSASLLALALTIGTPAWAVEKTKTHTSSEAVSRSDLKAEGKGKASAKASRKTSEPASADDSDVKPVKSSKSKASSSKSTKTADADTHKSVKVTKSKTARDKSELADADIKTSKSKSARAAGTKTKAGKGKADKAKTETTELAAKGKASAKAKASGKTVELADASPKAKPAPAKAVPGKTAAKPVVQLASAKTAKPGAIATLTRTLMSLPQSLFAANEPAPEPKVVLNTAPVPYTRIRSQAQNTTGVLNATDAQLYQTAFTQIDQGDFDGAEASLTQVSDRSLVGYAEFHKLFSLNYTATYEELTGWLSQYGDQPMAMRVWALAKRKKPEGSPDPAFPSLMGPQQVASMSNPGAAVQLSSTTSLAATHVRNDLNPGAPQLDIVDSDLTPKSARSAYNNGQLEQAVTLGRKIGDHWVAGLANWRLKRYDQALVEFKFVSTDPSRNAWSQSSGAYWAARSALKLGDKDSADTYFKIAASFPFTFYGLLAEQRLGVTPAVALARKGLPPTFQADTRDALTASLDDDFSWTQGNVQARRMSALVQIGRASDAQNEVQSAIQTSNDQAARDHWLALAAYNRIPVSQLKPTDRLFDASLYPTPDYKLRGGGVDRALVYAFARKESKFNAGAKSYSGAYGLLQLMPATAALVEGDSSFMSKPKQLLQPAVNLRVGQKYIQRLMDSKIIAGDLLRTIAAYNAGPRPVKDAVDSVGDDYDSLLVMESIPVAQTRQYVEEVAANYWIYRQIMGKDSPSLAQAAADARIIDASADAQGTPLAFASDDEAEDQ